MKAKIEIGLASVLPEKNKNNEVFENVVLWKLMPCISFIN